MYGPGEATGASVRGVPAARASCIARGLPVPAPVGARYRRSGLTYRCDLITQRIEAAQPMSALLAAGALSEATWRAVGAAVACLHRAGVDHPDLNAHNVLVGPDGAIRVIDFDRGRLREPGAWAGAISSDCDARSRR